MSDLCVFTTGTNLDLLRESCLTVNITLYNYPSDPWVGYVTGKLRGGIKFLTTRPEPFVMWLDGNDSLVLKPESEILSLWQIFGGPVIMAAESTCWPDAELEEKYPPAIALQYGMPRFLNAGGFIGPKGLVLTAMHAALRFAGDNEDDQRAWTAAYLAGALPDVQLDYTRTLFACVGDGNSALIAKSATLHWNGKIPGRKEYWDDIKAKRG